MFVHRTPFFNTEEVIQKISKEEKSDKVFLISKRATTGNYFYRDPGHIPNVVLADIQRDKISHDHIITEIFRNKWTWHLLFSTLTEAKVNRIIIAPSDEKKKNQSVLNDRLGAIRNHPSVYGFVRGKSAYDCAKAHTDKHNGEMGLLIKMDISNFFNSFSEEMIRHSLSCHGFNEEEKSRIVDNSMMDVSLSSPVVRDIIAELINKVMHRSGCLSQIAGGSRIKMGRDLAHAFLHAALHAKNEISSDEALGIVISRMGFTSTTIPCLSEMEASAVKNILSDILKCGPNTGFGNKMLFQGGPSSPFLSNLGFKLLDYRIHSYAEKCGGFYTRYADDMCFSFKDRRTTKEINLFISGITRMVREGGFSVNAEKTSVIGTGKSQKIVGYCVNSGVPTIPQEYRRQVYKEISELSKCNPDILSGEKVCRIQGMIAYIETANPDAAGKLRKELSKIHINKSKRQIEL